MTLAVESLADGCQLEDFNADVAAQCALVCQEPATCDVLERIAREERSHAEFSWAVLRWTLLLDAPRVLGPVRDARSKLAALSRPTAVSAAHHALVMRADVAALRRHGRLRDEEWATLWDARLAHTQQRLDALLAEIERAAA